LRKTLPEALKGITFNEIEVYQNKLAPLKYQIKNLMEFVFFHLG
jgi:hypothetical protein